MQPFQRAALRGGQQLLRAYKPKIMASKPKNNLEIAGDVVVLVAASAAIVEIGMRLREVQKQK